MPHMRQVDRDELTYQFFAAMRHWSISQRKRMLDRKSFGQAAAAWMGAKKIVDLAPWTAFDTARGEDLTKDELRDLLAAAILAFPGAVGGLWLSGLRDREHEARAAAANLLADALAPYELLMTVSDPGAVHSLQDPGARAAHQRFPELRVAPHALGARWP